MIMDKLIRFGNSNRFLPSIFNDDFFTDFFEGNRLPATNVTETKDAFEIELAVPGFDKDHFNIEVHHNVLTISGHVEDKQEEKNSNNKVIRREFKSSSFKRSFTLPEDVDVNKIAAEHKNGLLTLSIPKAEPQKQEVKKIEVK